MALPAAMCEALGLAILLNRPIRSQAVYRTIIFLPSLVPVAASAMIWFWLFNTKLGLINYGLAFLHIPPVGWLTNPNVALPHSRVTRLFIDYSGESVSYGSDQGTFTSTLASSCSNGKRCFRSSMAITFDRDTRLDMPFPSMGAHQALTGTHVPAQ